MISRTLTPILRKSLEKFPVLTLTGPRQSGKTTVLKHAFPEYKYFNLERLDYRQLIQSDPIGFLKNQGTKVIFDEAQQVPELFSYIQVISDERGEPGQYILSGSQSFLMNNHIAQSLAGRTAVFHLFPFDMAEIPIDKNVFNAIFTGFYPRIHDTGMKPDEFYPPYIQTYVERDVRTLQSIGNLTTFSRFLGLCAGRIGQIVNLTSLANDTGISVNTAKSWLSLLEASFIIYQLQPYYKNFNKRLVKSPKLYFYDTGLACSLLNISSSEMLQTHYLYGSLFENFIISEIKKIRSHSGLKPNIYYWRDNNGVEIDCIIDKGNNQFAALEIKGGATINNSYLKNFSLFKKVDEQIEKYVFYTGDESITLSDVEIVGNTQWKQTIKNMKY